MKRTISLLSILAFILAFSGTTFAQTTVDASATVEQEISITNVNNIAFGTVGQNSSPILDPNGTNSDVGSTASIGSLDINASTGTDIIISWNTDVVLSDGASTPETISMSSVDVDGRSDTDDPGGASDLTTNGGETVTTDGTSGDYYLYFGGALDLTGSSTGTTYSTSNSGGTPLTVEVQYK